jgi:Protein of unknown function (DUF3489)
MTKLHDKSCQDNDATSTAPVGLESNAPVLGSDGAETPSDATKANTSRAGSKIAGLVAILTRSEGACLDEMIERTGWQAHTVRAAMTGLRKKGYTIEKRMPGNITVWFIAK